MTNSKQQPDFDPHSVEEFKLALQHLADWCEKVLRMVEYLHEAKQASSQPSPCDDCAKRSDGCGKECGQLIKLIPGRYAGKIHGESTINLDLDKVRDTDNSYYDSEEDDRHEPDRSKLKNIEKVCSVDVFAEYQQCWKIFSKKQQEVLVLCRRDGKSITQVARELHKAVSTVWSLLDRAEKRKQKYYAKES